MVKEREVVERSDASNLAPDTTLQYWFAPSTPLIIQIFTATFTVPYSQWRKGHHQEEQRNVDAAVEDPHTQ